MVLEATLLVSVLLAAEAPQGVNARLAKSAVEQLRKHAAIRARDFWATQRVPKPKPTQTFVVIGPNRKCAVPLLRMRIPRDLDPSMAVKPPDVAVPMPQATPQPSCDNAAAAMPPGDFHIFRPGPR